VEKTTNITWTLRDSVTNEVFRARQEIVTDHSALYATLVCERPLVDNHIYETIQVSGPLAIDQVIKQADAAADHVENRLGYARGTHIMTARGEVPVENLRVGDRIITRDHGLQAVRWVGSEKACITAENAPILFRKGAIKNARDLVVSADQRIVVKGAEALTKYGVKEVLVPARELLNGNTIVQAVSGKMQFFQILTDKHEVIYAEASASESFMPNAAALAQLNENNKSEIFKALPILAHAPQSYGPCARGFIEPTA
jgi:hypothetical protein